MKAMLKIKHKIKNVSDINFGSFNFKLFINGVENKIQIKIYIKKFLK